MINKDNLKKNIMVRSKRNILLVIDIVFLIWIFISFVTLTKNILNEIEVSGGWSQISIKYNTIEIVFKFLLYYLIGVIIENFFIIAIYLSIKFAIKKYAKEKLSSIDFKKYEGYFRDILKTYSPAELSYIDDFELSYKNDTVATLLSLKLKGAISFNESNNTINVLNPLVDNLSQNEKYILNGIENGKLSNYNDDTFKSKVLEDALKNRILEDNINKRKKVLSKFLLVFFISVIVFPALAMILFTLTYNEVIPVNLVTMLLLVALFMIIGVVPFASLVFLFTYLAKTSKNIYYRTKIGEEVNEKIEGLKNYIKDYSSLDEKNKNDIIIWEDYLIYSVLFDQNPNLVNDIWTKYVKSY